MFRRASVLVAFAALSLAGCSSEHAAITTYFEDAQSIAERMVETSSSFETLINAQENPLEWSDAAKRELSMTLEAMRELRDDANAMTVPEAFVDVHPLLVQSLDEMIGAMAIIDEIAADPSLATMERADEMTKKAENGERLSNEYVAELEKILAEKYPELTEAE